MLFLNLTLNNFGVFRGRHSFELTPHLVENEPKRHVALISGHNGSGKTTIFQAMMLALHGSAQFGELQNLQRYHKFLLSRMHRHAGETISSGVESSVFLSFRYVRSGRHSEIAIERSWQKRASSVEEKLCVFQDGKLLDLAPEDYQAWIDGLMSPGIGSLCFFDAEQLDALVNQDQQSGVLRHTLERLLGLEWAERLGMDLDQLMSRQGSTKKIDHLYVKVLELRSDRDKLDEQLDMLKKERDETELGIKSIEDTLSQKERLLAAKGGAYAARRPVLQERLHTIKQEVDILTTQLSELCADLLPFSLAPDLCIRLYKKLLLEDEVRSQLALGTLLQERLPTVEKTLLEDDVWEDLQLHLSPQDQRYLIQKLLEKLSSLGSVPSQSNVDLVHHLSVVEQQRIMGWIRQIIRDVPQQVQLLGGKLRSLKEEQHRIVTDLERAPEEDVLAPIHAEITHLKESLIGKRRRLTALDGQIGSLQFQRNEKHRLLKDAIEQYDKVRKFEKQLTYAERSRNVILTYKDALTRQKLQAVEMALTSCFNKICRKEHLLSRSQIDPETFVIQLESIGGTPLSLSEFSAGEKQLYALSILWALRIVSGSPLPLAIDTPLARLDEVHRLRLIRDYIPEVSDQVLLFTTDAEMDESLLMEIRPYLSHHYQLSHNSQYGTTTVGSGAVGISSNTHS
jgi:DNA sulfur modification protein DndD